MAHQVPARALTLLLLLAVSAGLALLLRPGESEARFEHASATSQPCASCHVDSAGGGSLTAQGQAFQAIPSHGSDPRAAWSQISRPGATSTPSSSSRVAASSPLAGASAVAPSIPITAAASGSTPSAPTPTPGPVPSAALSLSTGREGGSLVYTLQIRNTGPQEITGLYVAG